MKQAVKVSFYLKKDEIKTDGTCSVIGRLTVGETSAKFSMKFYAPLSLWDTAAGRLKGKSKEATEMNEKLDKARVSANAHYKELSTLKDNITRANASYFIRIFNK